MKKQTKILLLTLCGLLLSALLYLFLSSQTRFLKFCDDFFKEEMESNALTLHYTVADPEKYDIQCSELSLGTYDTDYGPSMHRLLKKQLLLKTFFRSRLSADLQRLYDCLEYSLHTEMNYPDYILYEEPLIPSIGIQSQLPILFAEYSFGNESDVINYLALLKCIPQYVDSIISLEEAKISEGLFMDEASAGELITYCKEFCTGSDNHFLSDTFKERLLALNLTPEKQTAYLKENLSILETHVFPSYEKLRVFLKTNQSQGLNSDGLYYYPKGTGYYSWLLRSEIGCDLSFEKIEELLDQALKKDAAIIAKLTKNHPKLLSDRNELSLDTSNPAGLASYLSKRITHDFPEIPDVQLKVCDVPKSMEPHLSPAFYLIPPIDRGDENIVYLNQSCLEEGLSFFTTLAHESYPGHLYQNVYENNTKPHPLQRLLYFGGYTEGWATYSEQLSYFYAPISDDLARLLSTTNAMTLNLYSHLDLYVHAYGWTEADCFTYLKKFGITNTASVHDMFLLVKQQPANYLKYYLGYLEICKLKEQARNCLGSNFDLKKFHEFILTYGPAPFSLLEAYFQDWIQTQEQGFSEPENP